MADSLNIFIGADPLNFTVGGALELVAEGDQARAYCAAYLVEEEEVIVRLALQIRC